MNTDSSAAWLLDFRKFAPRLIHIRTKEETITRLHLNPMQQLWFSIAEQHKRTITLKARQHGISTVIDAAMYHAACTRPGYRGVLIAQDNAATERLRAKIRLMHKMHIATGAPAPQAKYDTKAEMVFQFGSRYPESTIYIGTAGSRTFGRGDTISAVHGSEVAFWANPLKLLTGLAEAVPRGGEIHLESTANGFNEFYNMCEDARLGISGYEFIFIPWYSNPEYAISPGIPQKEWTQDEQELAIKAIRYGHTITPENIAFRRSKQKDLKLAGTYAQEYAEDDQTCYLLTGRPRFNNEKLGQYLARCADPISTRYIKNSQLVYRIRETPQAGELYIVGADASQGVNSGDNSIGRITKWKDGKQVAELAGRADPFTFADSLYDVGIEYNRAIMAPERKESGIAVVARLVDRGYPRMFYYLDANNKLADQPGIDTNTHTRPIAIDLIAQLVEDNPGAFINAEEVGELMKFIITETGKAEAAQGAHDDRVAALWCSELARQQSRPPRTEPLPRREILGKQR